MVILIECFILCLLFTVMVYIMSRNPIATLYNYPPKIQERVKSIEEYRDKIPTTKKMIGVKMFVAIFIIIIVSLILRYINDYTNFSQAFTGSLIIWTIVNIYDILVMDIIWFCHSPKFIFNGTEDILKEYKNYWFHIKEGIIGQFLGTIICILIGLIVHFIL